MFRLCGHNDEANISVVSHQELGCLWTMSWLVPASYLWVSLSQTVLIILFVHWSAHSLLHSKSWC